MTGKPEVVGSSVGVWETHLCSQNLPASNLGTLRGYKKGHAAPLLHQTTSADTVVPHESTRLADFEGCIDRSAVSCHRQFNNSLT